MIDIKRHISTISFLLIALILFCLISDFFFNNSLIEGRRGRGRGRRRRGGIKKKGAGRSKPVSKNAGAQGRRQSNQQMLAERRAAADRVDSQRRSFQRGRFGPSPRTSN